MTSLQKTLITATIAVVTGFGIYEANKASRLQRELHILTTSNAPLTGQMEKLTLEHNEALYQLARLQEENERLKRHAAEIHKLRGEASLLRRNQELPTGQTNTGYSQITNEPSPEDIGGELGAAVVRGEPGALGRVTEISKTARKSFNTNSVGLSDTLRDELARQTFGTLWRAFDVIAEAASQGNQLALDAIVQAAQISELKGVAIQSLGKVAGSGNEAALETLLNGHENGHLLSSTVGALQVAAGNGNQKAIDALIAVTKDEKHRALWQLAAFGLMKGAESGNPEAVEALIGLSASTNRSVRASVVEGLKKAAANQNARAAEALRAMGVP